jgi:hypothetical protein
MPVGNKMVSTEVTRAGIRVALSSVNFIRKSKIKRYLFACGSESEKAISSVRLVRL